MIEDRNSGKMSYDAIAERYQFSLATVWNHVEPHSTVPSGKRAPFVTPELVTAMVEAYNGGMSQRETAEKVGVSIGTVNRYLTADPRVTVRPRGSQKGQSRKRKKKTPDAQHGDDDTGE
jgi:transposase